MEISTDQHVFAQWGFVTINATLVYSWAVMALLVGGAWLAGRRLTGGRDVGRLQVLLETVVSTIRGQIAEITMQDPRPFLGFLGTLYLFIATANLLAFVPGYHPPTASLSTTSALALCALAATLIHGVRRRGVIGFLRHYTEPTLLALPFNVMGEISRTVAMAVRLFGNVMSGMVMIAILLMLAPLLLPVPLHVLELLIGQVQAYIFAVLATVYIGSVSRTEDE